VPDWLGEDIRWTDNDMALSSVHRQPRAQADDMHPYVGLGVGLGLYDYTADTSTYGEYAECLGIGNFYPQSDLLDGFNVEASDTDTAVVECQDSASSSSLTTRPVVYPWMKRRHRRNGRSI